jgi:hypothetical protein
MLKERKKAAAAIKADRSMQKRQIVETSRRPQNCPDFRFGEFAGCQRVNATQRKQSPMIAVSKNRRLMDRLRALTVRTKTMHEKVMHELESGF